MTVTKPFSLAELQARIQAQLSCYDRYRRKEAWREGGTLLLVQNEGEGISAEEQANVFRPFYQTAPERSKKGRRGTGLGLNIAQMIVERHRGRVAIYSVPSVGTVVAVWLPAEREEENG